MKSLMGLPDFADLNGVFAIVMFCRTAKKSIY